MKCFKCKWLVLVILFIFYAECLLSSGFAQTEIEGPVPVNVVDVHNKEISINVQNIEIQDFFSGLARARKVNIIPSKDVSGTISVNLHNIPLAKAIEAVSVANGYQCVKKNGIYFIVEEETQSGKKKPGIGSTIKSFRVNFANMSEVRTVIEDIVGEDNFTVHREAKTVIVEDSIENIEKVEKVLKSIDYPPKQVLIEAKILEIKLGENLQFGVDWQKTFTQGEFVGTAMTGGFSLPSTAEGAKGIFLDVINNDGDLKARLDALDTKSEMNVLATPKLLAVDGKSAEIIIGGRLGYYVVTTTEISTLQNVEFLDTGTQLKLTPHISDGNKILLEIHPSVSEGSIDELGLPSESTTEVSTCLLAEHGDTIFIGGLIRERREHIREKIPILGSIPLIGTFFSRTNDRVSKTEIIILITPYIILPEDEMIYAEKVDKVRKAQEIHQRKRTAVEKLFYPEKMFDKVHKTGKDGDIQIRKRRGTSSVPEKDMSSMDVDTDSRDISKKNISSAEQKVSGEKKDAGSTPHNSFLLQVGAFYKKENAVKMTEHLKQQGYPAYSLVARDKTGSTLTRVKVGPLKTRKLAEEYAHQLEEEGITVLIFAGSN